MHMGGACGACVLVGVGWGGKRVIWSMTTRRARAGGACERRERCFPTETNAGAGLPLDDEPHAVDETYTAGALWVEKMGG